MSGWTRAGLVVALLVLGPTPGHADESAGERKAQLCLLCHKPNNPVAIVPTLEGQPREYIFRQVKAYQEKRRPDIQIVNFLLTKRPHPHVDGMKDLSKEEAESLAQFFASLE